MSRLRTNVLPVALLISAFALSACSTNPKQEAVAEPAPAVIAVETPAAPEPAPAPPVAVVEPAPVPAPAAMTEPPAPKPVVKKARKTVHKAKVAAPKAPEPEPVAAPVPVVQQAPAAVAPVPTPIPVIAQPIQPTETPGFFAKYWLWLFGILIAAVAIFWFTKKK